MTEAQPWAGRRLHFIGIGGAGMSGLALVAHALGAQVSGSDRAESATLERLRGAGMAVIAGHAAEHVPDGAEVVYSTAVPYENPERAVARGRAQRELHRADLLGEITELRRCIAVTGTHGKTTTTSMVVHALRGCGLDPGYLVGGEVRSTGSNAGWGAGEWVVVEADESDRSLLKLHPDIAVLTNSELDHHATYASQQELDDTFRTFLARATEGVVVWDRPELRALAPDAVAYDVPDPLLDAVGSRFTWRDVEVRLPIPGAHNALNAAAALEACRLAGADPRQAAAALADFPGAGRRFELLGTTAVGVPVYDDYAHHPTEVAATIAAARTLAADRVIVVFQPHLYSRTRELADEFGAALAAADLALVLDVYPARERAEDFPGVGAALIAEAGAAAGGAVIWEPDFDAAQARLHTALQGGDICIVMGAGDVDVLGRRLVAS